MEGAATWAIPAVMALFSAGAGYYNNQQSMSNQRSMADDAYQRQLEFQNNQQAWQTASEEKNKAWITAQQAAQKAAYQEQQNKNEALYKQYAYANKDATDARRNQLIADAANSRETAMDQLARSMSTRGWGPGSGAVANAAGQVSNQYLKDIGKAYNEVTEFANKPFFQYPFTTSNYFTPMNYSSGNGISQGSSSYGSGGSSGMSSVTSPLSSLIGMSLYKTLSGNDNTTSGYESYDYYDNMPSYESTYYG